MIDYKLSYEEVSKRVKNASRKPEVSERTITVINFGVGLAILLAFIFLAMFIIYPLVTAGIELGVWIGGKL